MVGREEYKYRTPKAFLVDTPQVNTGRASQYINAIFLAYF